MKKLKISVLLENTEKYNFLVSMSHEDEFAIATVLVNELIKSKN